jgi:hypothetical protein
MLARLASALLAAAIASACMISGTGTFAVEATSVVYSDPPAPQDERFEVRPGFVWVHGHQSWINGAWVWTAGHYEHERPGFAWTEGRWEHRGNSWQWIGGSWTANAVAAPPMARDRRY